jgi:hypothetical protein
MPPAPAPKGPHKSAPHSEASDDSTKEPNAKDFSKSKAGSTENLHVRLTAELTLATPLRRKMSLSNSKCHEEYGLYRVSGQERRLRSTR